MVLAPRTPPTTPLQLGLHLHVVFSAVRQQTTICGKTTLVSPYSFPNLL